MIPDRPDLVNGFEIKITLKVACRFLTMGPGDAGKIKDLRSGEEEGRQVKWNHCLKISIE
jgi:hypothetical protein